MGYPKISLRSPEEIQAHKRAEALAMAQLPIIFSVCEYFYKDSWRRLRNVDIMENLKNMFTPTRTMLK